MSGSRFGSVMLAVTFRRFRHFLRNPAVSLPSFAMPLFFLAFGGGGLSNLGNVPAFDFPSGYTAFFFAYVVLQGAAFAGAATGAAIAADFETGFARRLLLAAPHRASVVAGYILASVTLALVVMLFLTAVAVAAGMNVDGNALELVGLYGLGVLLTVVSSLWAAGFALRTRIMQAQPGATMPIFLSLMLSPAFVPRPLLSDWLRTAADYNPFTAILESSRGLISGQPDETAFAYLIAFGLIIGFSAWAVTGLRLALRST